MSCRNGIDICFRDRLEQPGSEHVECHLGRGKVRRFNASPAFQPADGLRALEGVITLKGRHLRIP